NQDLQLTAIRVHAGDGSSSGDLRFDSYRSFRLDWSLRKSAASAWTLVTGRRISPFQVEFEFLDLTYDLRFSRVTQRYCTPGSTQSISNSRLAARMAVWPKGSYGGDTSTRSQPTRSRPRRPRTISSACCDVRPPTSTVPVPGA